MYQPETILVLKEPRGTEEEPFAYDRVEVVGASPINHATISDEWSGTATDGQGVIIKPLEAFGSTLDKPFGELQKLYDVESIPEIQAVPVQVTVERDPRGLGPTPEEVFAKEAPAEASDGPHRRSRTKLDPFTEELSEEEKAERAARKEAIQRGE